MLRHYLLFMANSGLRPNEARQLLWRDIREEQDEDGTPALVIEVAPTTKTGARTVVCREGTGHYLERLKKISKHTEPDDYVFCGFDGEPVDNFNNLFKKVLSGIGLLEDRWGKRRSIYSLRHFYCTQSLLSGVPIHVLAKNMGTSISHIEQHYSHVLTLMQAKQLQTKKFRPAKRKSQLRHQGRSIDPPIMNWRVSVVRRNRKAIASQWLNTPAIVGRSARLRPFLCA